MAIQFGSITEADLNAHLNRKKTDNEILDEAMLKRFGITHVDVFPTEPYKRASFHAKRIRKIAKIEQAKSFDGEHIVSTINQDHIKSRNFNTSGCNASIVNKARATSVKQACMKLKRNLKFTPGKMNDLIHSVCKIAFKRDITVTFIGKRRQTLKTQRHRTSRFSCMKLETKHSVGKIQNVDVHIPHTIRGFVSVAALKLWKGPEIHERDIKRGDSGSIIPRTKLLGYAYSQFADIFIVRGRDRTLLLDSQSYVATKYMGTITHYSTAEQYWKGYDQTFRSARVNQVIHETPEKFSVSDCGAVDAILHQALLPCCRITCTVCAKILEDSSSAETRLRVSQSARRGAQMIRSNYPNFEHVYQLLMNYATLIDNVNDNREACGKIQFLIGERTEAPFTHVLRINEVLLRGNRATSNELSEASNNLLEVARYLKNRTEHIQKGSLKSFRNKASGKAHINPQLMCDNQLDANGNFVWGKRGYHAKRFFTNYFEEIEPTQGYDHYAIRRFPNGSRKLAIGHLILSTNLDVLRKQLEGEPIEAQPLTDACVSRRHDSFIYPCSCVTYDDGTPVLSEVKAPTKNHLVLGNTGDSKYLDLPTDGGNKLYIAKEGYCYMNIFLAMLVNVDEQDAKDFTKWVRDITAEQLGQWPQISDLALACHQLTILFPSTRSAELPRILIDHKTKTMHVIDSYGSLTTNFHVLKANTVSQLIAIASDTLESELKHYRVGGTPTSHEAIRNSSMRLLIQGVYRPKVLRQILEQDPYVLVLAILSPAVLKEMFVSGSLYEATLALIPEDLSARALTNLLTSLATRVARITDLDEQMKLIEQNLGQFMEVLSVGDRCSLSRHFAQQMIMARLAAIEVDLTLDDSGYRTLRWKATSVLEKIYKEDLQASWDALGSYGKLRIITQRVRWRSRITRDLTAENAITFGGALRRCRDELHQVTQVPQQVARTSYTYIGRKIHNIYSSILMKFMAGFTYYFHDLFRFVQIVSICCMFIAILETLQRMRSTYRSSVMKAEQFEYQTKQDQVEHLYKLLCMKLGVKPTYAEFYKFVIEINPDLKPYLYEIEEKEVEHQAAKRESEVRLEQIVAFTALVLMVFDNERSDCVYRVMNKFKNIVSVADQDVNHQSVDDTVDNFDENETISFELDSSDPVRQTLMSTTFSKWWDNQLSLNRTMPHYRTEGHFMEFTRNTCASVVNNIVHNDHKDILLRGAVGSGKSTGLPAGLCTRGKVLVIEPTKPLCQNVLCQLRADPFHLSPSLMMRDTSVFGSTPIMIMTSGFALHYFANNPIKLKDYQFVLFDECHVLDANAMAYRCLLEEHQFEGKIIKVSATPPGREVEFTTQYPVDVRVEEILSFREFISSLGTGANADITNVADNILVYVSSYNEVDSLAKMLLDKGYMVTKVDGRTMKNGPTDIVTRGSKSKKHFVVATNIIENGVTLDIEAVVDFGTKVVPELCVDNRRINYTKCNISYGERIQRLGRVGRCKPGVALRVGITNKNMSTIPPIIATEAAFLCFTYGLPVMTAQVSLSLLANCTVQQARVMKLFELPTFFMQDLVHHDGTMHPAIHNLLKRYKLRESEIVLNKRAIPYACIHDWADIRHYNAIGANLSLHPDVKIPFFCKDLPELLLEKLWTEVLQNRSDACFRTLTTHNAARVAYKLKTDVNSLQRTINIIDMLIIEEMRKKSYFDSLVTNTCTSASFSLQSISNLLTSRYKKNHTLENISILTAAKAQLLDFRAACAENVVNLGASTTKIRDKIIYNGALETVLHESRDDVIKTLGLQGKWNGTLLTRDILVCLGAVGGGIWLLYQYLKDFMNETVNHQAKSKRQRQKLKFRDAHDKKLGRIVEDDDSGAVEHYFGEAYAKKGKKGGQTRGMGKKTRRFVNMYGFDESEYTYIRFVDPITGEMKDENIMTDIALVQEHFGDLRREYIVEDKILTESIRSRPGIIAYFVKDQTSPILRVDLTPHIPLKVCDNNNTIAGFPEYEGVLRQTGRPTKLSYAELPKMEVDHEAKSLNRGLRDYNPISKAVCLLENRSDGHSIHIHGIGFGSYIITNRHLFKRNNGNLVIKSTHGEFVVPNTVTMKTSPVPDCDIVIVQLPKDFPPFPTKLKFREPEKNDQVCMVGTNFQEKFLSSTISSTSYIQQVKNTQFFKHWIDTKDGQCGLPLVSTRDGHIVGLHSLTNMKLEYNCFAAITTELTNMLNSQSHIEWKRGWLYNPNDISWGIMQLKESTPSGSFKPTKSIHELAADLMREQSGTNDHWFENQLHCNLKAVGYSTSQLVTKHVVKGKCALFARYLDVTPEAMQFFGPLMGAYQKSRLNRIAYAKDALKYATPIIVGNVDTDSFEIATEDTIQILRDVGFQRCNYITDPMEIVDNLNMKAATGALYTGKKKDYFKDYTGVDFERILQESALRLYSGKKGIWNGAIKAELRPIEKVLADKTRTFTAAPLDTLLAGKICVDDFNLQFYDLHTKGPWSVGISKFACGWDTLLRKLPDGWVYCDADGSRFDSSLTPYIINAVPKIRLAFMEEWDIGEQMIRNLYTEIVYTPILTADGTIVKKFKGNNSGQPSTVVDNTLMVILAMQYALRRLGLDATEQKANCVYFANGDDLVVAVSPNYTYILDNLQKYFEELGLNYDFCNRCTKREELWFMSHRGMLRDSMYIPKLEKERIVSILEWDRATEPAHRLEAICASMVEAWGYDDLIHEIRKFYAWVLEQAPYNVLASEGKAPYISDYALRRLYTEEQMPQENLDQYLRALVDVAKERDEDPQFVEHQSGATDTVDAADPFKRNQHPTRTSEPQPTTESATTSQRTQLDKDVNVGTSGTFRVPRLKGLSSKLSIPKVRGNAVVNLPHLLQYNPNQEQLSNARATDEQFSIWYEGVKSDYDVTDDEMHIIMNGLMVWCIENGTSPNLNGMWVMMDGDTQVTYPIKPLLDHAQPTLRQIMHHFSNLAEAYIEKQNYEKPYMPRYGRIRNLTDMSLARYAFDFYEVTSRTPVRAREAHMQMKAAALRNASTKLFGLDGKVGTQIEDTERHTAEDVNQHMHNLLGVRGVM